LFPLTGNNCNKFGWSIGDSTGNGRCSIEKIGGTGVLRPHERVPRE
jgi:hypothetical protein